MCMKTFEYEPVTLRLRVCVCKQSSVCVVWWEADRKGVCRSCLSSGNAGFRKRKLQTLISVPRCSLMSRGRLLQRMCFRLQVQTHTWSWRETRRQGTNKDGSVLLLHRHTVFSDRSFNSENPTFYTRGVFGPASHLGGGGASASKAR